MSYRTLIGLTLGLMTVGMPVLAQDAAPASAPATAPAPAPGEDVAAEAPAATPTDLKVEITLAKDVVDREPVEAAETFSVTAGQVVGWTLIQGADVPTEVRHVWSFEGNEVATVPLAVKSARYRTWTRKNIGDRVGSWSFAVTDANGNTLASKDFEVTGLAASE